LVSDDEQLYRSVRNETQFFKTVDGAVRFSNTCFNDPAGKVSVDRANLRNSAEETKFSPSDGIIKLLARDIRDIGPIPNPDGGDGYLIDVHPRPIPADNPDGLPENLSHAQIEASPDFTNPSRFKKLKEALALLADGNGWFIAPS
jgi:hypothetical protein